MVAIASDEERSYPLANEAAQQFEKVAKSWAAGEIFQSAYNIDTPIQCETYIQYMYQPQIDESKLTEEPKRELKLPFVGLSCSSVHCYINTAHKMRPNANNNLGRPMGFIYWR